MTDNGKRDGGEKPTPSRKAPDTERAPNRQLPLNSVTVSRTIMPPRKPREDRDGSDD